MNSALADAAAISTVTVKLWTREVAVTFQSSEKRVRITVLAVAVGAALFGFGLAAASSAQLTADTPDMLRLNILRTAFGSAIVIPAIVSTILCLTMPARTSLQTLLDMLPVARPVARAGQIAPSFILGLGFSAVLCSTTAAVVVKIYPDAAHVVLAIVLLVSVIVIVQGLAMGVFTILSSALRRYARLPQQYCAALAGAAVILLGIAAIANDLLSFTPAVSAGFTAPDLLLHRAVAAAIAGPTQLWAWPVIAGWAVTSAFVLWISFCVYRQEQTTDAIHIVRGMPAPRAPFVTAVWFELLVSARNPQAVMTVILIAPAIVGIYLLSGVPVFHELAANLALSVPVFPCFLAVYAVGRTVRVHWVGVHLLAKPLWWVSPKGLSYAFGALLLGSATFIVELLIGLVEAASVANVIARVALALGAALLAGAIVPYSDEQPLSMTVSGFLAAVTYLAVVGGLGWLAPSITEPLLWLVTLLAASGLFLGYLTAAAGHRTDDIRRA